VLLVHPDKLEGQEEVSAAERRERRPKVWAGGLRTLPRRVPVMDTRLVVQDPGRAPHSPVLLEATRRAKAPIPAGRAQEEGMVPLRRLLLREREVRRVRELHAAGNVPVS
jgi:hypothetical protein